MTLAVVGIAAVALAGCQLKEDSMNYSQNESEVMIILLVMGLRKILWDFGVVCLSSPYGRHAE